MGVRSLLRYIRLQHSDCIEALDLSSLSNCCIAIDGNNFMHYVAAKVDAILTVRSRESVDGKDVLSAMCNVMVHCLSPMLKNNIEVVVVMDGQIPEMKLNHSMAKNGSDLPTNNVKYRHIEDSSFDEEEEDREEDAVEEDNDDSSFCVAGGRERKSSRENQLVAKSTRVKDRVSSSSAEERDRSKSSALQGASCRHIKTSHSDIKEDQGMVVRKKQPLRREEKNTTTTSTFMDVEESSHPPHHNQDSDAADCWKVFSHRCKKQKSFKQHQLVNKSNTQLCRSAAKEDFLNWIKICDQVQGELWQDVDAAEILPKGTYVISYSKKARKDQCVDSRKSPFFSTSHSSCLASKSTYRKYRKSKPKSDDCHLSDRKRSTQYSHSSSPSSVSRGALQHQWTHQYGGKQGRGSDKHGCKERHHSNNCKDVSPRRQVWGNSSLFNDVYRDGVSEIIHELKVVLDDGDGGRGESSPSSDMGVSYYGERCGGTNAHSIVQFMNAMERKSYFVDLMLMMGIQVIRAEGEAEMLCCALMDKRRVAGVLSRDTDHLVLGCSNLMISLNNDFVENLNMTKLLDKLNLTQKEFIDFCILCGTDYNMPNGGLSRCLMSPEKAIHVIQTHKSIEKAMQNMRLPNTNFAACRETYSMTKDVLEEVNEKLGEENIKPDGALWKANKSLLKIMGMSPSAVSIVDRYYFGHE